MAGGTDIELASGAIVGGKYRLEHVLGEGGMAIVWSAKHVVTQRPVALKLLKSREPVAVRRFLREARIAGSLAHDAIVQVHDVLQLEDGTPGLVMDLLAGETLAARIAREGKLALDEVGRIIVPVLDAVAVAHRAGVVHRDLKPENVFLEDRGGALHVTVLDFGIAKVVEPDDRRGAKLTDTGAVIGTPHYMAPEQLFGEGVDARADVWALGVILHEMLTGKRPYEGENAGQVFKAVALAKIPRMTEAKSEIAALVARMMSRDREARPSLEEVRAAFAGGAPARRSRAKWALAFVPLAMAAGAVAWIRSPRPKSDVAAIAPPSVVASSVPEPVIVTPPFPPAIVASGAPSAVAKAIPKAPPKAEKVVVEDKPAPSVTEKPAPEKSALPGGVHGVSPY